MQATLIIPVYNGSTTLAATLKSLEKQNEKNLIAEIIIIDDNSQDDSRQIIEKFSHNSAYKVKYLINKTNQGLASNYNRAIKLVTSPFFILMHQDIVLDDKNSINKVITPLLKDNALVGCFPSFEYKLSTWRKNSFWQQVLFSRVAGKPTNKLNGKFDCIRKIPNLFFDEERYRTAGEDFDYEMRLTEHGKIKHVKLAVNHIQYLEDDFSLRMLVKKEAQLAECYGVNFRRYFSRTSLLDTLILVSRLLLLALLIFGTYTKQYYLYTFLVLYCYFYTAKVYKFGWKNPKILILPFVNVLNLLSYNYFFVRGIITNKQRI